MTSFRTAQSLTAAADELTLAVPRRNHADHSLASLGILEQPSRIR
ncbi:MAG: hypothetical protein ACPGLY_08220 [Rubripirellula sp.]